jgi:hypothetical protein
MARAVDRRQWNHTAAVLAMLVNTRAFGKGKQARPEQFHPYLKGKSGGAAGGMRLTKDTLKFLAIAMGATGIDK